MDDGNWLGVVHFSEDHYPRHYYHIMVVLEKETFAPIKYSSPFYFEKLGILKCLEKPMKYDK